MKHTGLTKAERGQGPCPFVLALFGTAGPRALSGSPAKSYLLLACASAAILYISIFSVSFFGRECSEELFLLNVSRETFSGESPQGPAVFLLSVLAMGKCFDLHENGLSDAEWQ